MSEPTLEVTEDRTDELKRIIDSFRKDTVLIGIPSEDSQRKGKQAINNATLMFINEFGSPGQNIPARTPMATGIKLAQPAISEEYKKALVAAFSKGFGALTTYYNRIGTIASNSVKAVINQQTDMQALSESTLMSREAKGFSGTKALIVTGQLRNSITYVVKE